MESLEPTWARALERFDASMRANGMAERTRRAYRSDLDQLARWASRHGLAPAGPRPPDLRRFAGVLSERGDVEVHGGAKDRGLPLLLPAQVERGEIESNPADLVARPGVTPICPPCSSPPRWRGCSRACRAATRWSSATGRCFELAYSAGLRAEELVNAGRWRRRPRRRGGARGGQGRPHPGDPGRRARVASAARTTWPAGGPSWPEPASPTRRSSSPRAGAGCPRPTSGAAWPVDAGGPRCRRVCRRTRSATRSPPISWRAAPTCGRSRNCWDTRPSTRPRRTLG